MTEDDLVLAAASGGVADLARLMEHLPPQRSALGAEAARAAELILRRTTPEDLAWLERRRPRWHPGGHGLGGHDLANTLGAMPSEHDGPHAATIALASMHPSGFVRERAVRLLSRRRDGGELPFLLLRVNDWVAPVREAAEAALLARLAPANAGHFVRSFALVEDLRGVRRAAHRALADAIDGLLARSECTRAVLDGLSAPSRVVRRACARVAARARHPELLRRAMIDGDPLVATAAAQAITACFPDDALREVLPVLHRGPPRVRALALEATCARFRREAEPHLLRGLLDESTRVRELARHLWRKIGLSALDFATFYRETTRSSTGPAFAIALRGLAETGGEPDAPLFEPHARDPRAAVRLAAIMGLGRCGRARYGDTLLAAVDDPSPRVSNMARAWVRMSLGRAFARRGQGAG